MKDLTCSQILDRVLRRFPESGTIHEVEFLGLFPEMKARDVWFTWQDVRFRLSPSLGGIVPHEIVDGKEETGTPLCKLVYHILNPTR